MRLFIKNAFLILIESIRKPSQRSILLNGRLLNPRDTISFASETGESSAEANDRKSILVEPGFKLVLMAVVILTVIFLVVSIVLSFVKSQTDQQKQLFEICTTLLKMGFGGILGLIGGKAT
jgi:hypothetical protein